MTESEFLAQTRSLYAKDFSRIEKAVSFAKLAHDGQKRNSGEPFFNHVLETAQILFGWQMDADTLIAGLLHDSVEDGGATMEDLEKEFGKSVRELVDGVTKVGKVRLRGSTNEMFVENLRKMFLAMSNDLRVVIVKLADRLHNMRTLGFVLPAKQGRIAKETIEVYAPLADRLGMGGVKGELEDLAFPFLYPEDYKWLSQEARNRYKKADKLLLVAKQKILKDLAESGVEATISAREKHLYSLYQKLLRPEINRDLSLVHDILALRILVPTVAHCYQALGVVHGLFKPVPELGLSDYIALPKPNGYKSIHTRVFGPKGMVMEVQIRTYEMHEQAEFGVAAHWHYAQEKQAGKSDTELQTKGAFANSEKLAWVSQLAKWQEEVKDGREFIDALKFDMLSKRIFVLTPRGDVKDLPAGATPVDFSYALHSKIGGRTAGAKVNGKMVGLNFVLKSGDVCEIILAKEGKMPSEGWLDFVVTKQARTQIKKEIKNRKNAIS